MKMRSAPSFLLLMLGLGMPWNGGDALPAPVIRRHFPSFHTFATYRNSNAYLYRGKNSDVYVRFPKSTLDSLSVLPSYRNLIKVAAPYQQSVLSSSHPLLPYSPQGLPSNEVVIPGGIGGLKVFLSPPPIQHDFVEYQKFPNGDNFNGPATIHRISNSKPIIDKQLISIEGIKINEDRGLSERLRILPNDNSVVVPNNIFVPGNNGNENLNEAPKERSPILHDSIQSSLIEGSDSNFNSPPAPVENFGARKESDRIQLPQFDLPSSSSSDAKTDSRDNPNGDFKLSDLDFTIPSSNFTSLIDDFKSDPDFSFPIISNSSKKPDADSPKIEDINSLQSGEKGPERDSDLLDILDKVGKADDKHRLEDSNSENNQPLGNEPEMQNRQDSNLEQPAPFFPPASRPQQPSGPSGSSFFPSPPQYQTSEFFPNAGNESPSQQAPTSLGIQDRPQFPGLPAPPQFQTDTFFPGNNRFQLPMGQQQPQQPPSSPGLQDQPQPSPVFPGLPAPPQFQTNRFFPSNNRFQLPNGNGNGQMPQPNNPPQFPPFGPSGGPFPRNFPGAPPFGPEPENGYNPNHMFEEFPEPPYESEFTGFPEEDLPPQSSNPVEGRQETTSPNLDFAQSTLRGVNIEEILNVVDKKPVPPDCVYNSVSYGLNGEDCIQRKKKKK